MPNSITFTGSPIDTITVTPTGGIPATVVPAGDTIIQESRTAVTLPRYARIIRLSETVFFGVNRDSDASVAEACRRLWSQADRNMIARYLAEAQIEIENEVGYFLQPTWVEGLPPSDSLYISDRYVDQQDYNQPGLTRWMHVIAPGVRAVDIVDEDAAVVHAADPAVITIPTSLANTNGITVYHPDTNVEIIPESITITGGNLVIRIPRARMLKEENVDAEWDYGDTSGFEQTVDVMRVYNDPSTNAEFVYPHSCSNLCAASYCAEQTRDACMYVEDYKLGIFTTARGSYTDDAWGAPSVSSPCCHGPFLMRLNYVSGIKTLTAQMEDCIVRLAHAKMPVPPCGCPEAQRMWERDRNMPKFISTMREFNPFGQSDGALYVYRQTQQPEMRIVRGSIMR